MRHYYMVASVSLLRPYIDRLRRVPAVGVVVDFVVVAVVVVV